MIKKTVFPALLTLCILAVPTGNFSAAEPGEAAFAVLRERMVADQIVRRGIRDRQVIRAMTAVPRHRFVPGELKDEAYDDNPLPIGYGQTISQPYIVAYMTQIAQASREHTILEVGTGSGYQAAILAAIAGKVYTIEIIPELAEKSSLRLKEMRYGNVAVRCSDGYYGWPEHAPFDAIIVTAAAGHIPPPLLKQLKPGGRMVIPVGGPFMIQSLVLAKKDEAGAITTRNLMSVRFVPLTGKR
jgi:protein-L-isoaspartate(D-aspartate) O-methyltransferase